MTTGHRNDPLMKKLFTLVVFLMLACTGFARTGILSDKQDTTEVLNYIAKGFDVRLIDATQTVAYASKALDLARKLKFNKGVADAYRMRGLGEHYLGHNEKAIENYFSALNSYQEIKNILGEVRIYLNISSLYMDIDYDKCLEYLDLAMAMYKEGKLDNNDLLASIHVNLGNVQQLRKNFNKALVNYNAAYDLINKMDNREMKAILLQNLGQIHFTIGNYDKARDSYFDALKLAKMMDLNSVIAQIDVSLGELYINLGEYNSAEKYLQEGRAYAILSKNDKLLKLFDSHFYFLELKRKNYERALNYLQVMHHTDSLEYSARNSAALSLFQAKYKQEQQEQKIKSIEEQRKYQNSIAIGTIVLAALLVVVIMLLISNVKRKTDTNRKLTQLNTEISIQKDNLDRINHHLEEIIDERTKDLQLKNKKLSEYSSHLSHQVRGPIATLKGLMNLEREGLVSQEECIQMMVKCVSEIDDKIIDMSDMLHNPERAGM
jgi:tetratricopeptide (TPR) repeat protein